MNQPIAYFAIRDDDTNYFTRPEDLESCYGKIWDVCPVSLSVVPFHACTKSGAVPKNRWSGDEIFPLERNHELAACLREGITRGRIHIMLHGYHHRDEPDGYEFDAGADLESKVTEGKAYLEALLGQKIKVFVPPHNTLSPAGYRAVLKAGMDISGIQSFKPSSRGWDPRVIVLGVKRRILHRQAGNIDRWPLVFPDGHKEFPYHSLTPNVTFGDLSNQLERILQKGGVFCIATHYWEFDVPGRKGTGTIRQNLDKLWDRIMSVREQVVFSTLADLGEVRDSCE